MDRFQAARYDPGMLSREEVDAYRRDGYVTPEYRLPEAWLKEIREAHSRLLERHPEFVDYCSAVLAYDTWFLNVARIPAILEMVSDVLGDDVALWKSSSQSRPEWAHAHPGIRTASTGRSIRWRHVPCGSRSMPRQPKTAV